MVIPGNLKTETTGSRQEGGPTDREMQAESGRGSQLQGSGPGVKGARRETGQPDVGAATRAGLLGHWESLRGQEWLGVLRWT